MKFTKNNVDKMSNAVDMLLIVGLMFIKKILLLIKRTFPYQSVDKFYKKININ